MHFDTVAAGVKDEALGGPEAHWLAVEQASQEGCRVVELEPCRGVHDVGEAHRMAFRETKIGKRGHLFPDAVGDLAGRAVLCHAGIKTCPQTGHAFGATFGPHRLA